MKSFAPIVLRIGIGAVIVWFGTQQLINPAPWVSFLPEFTKSLPISQINFIYLNGWFEIVFGLCLIVGLYTRIVSFFLAGHMLGIVFSLGYDAIAVRDFGLAVALISTFLNGESDWSLDKFFSSRSQTFLEPNSQLRV